jgi:protein TonB
MSLTDTATVSSATPLPAAPFCPAHPVFSRLDAREPAFSPGLAQTLTLVLWAGCLTVGALGLSLHYSRPRPPVAEPPPVVVEKIDVDLSPTLPPLAMQPADPSSNPPPPAALEKPSLAQPIAVAEPTAVAFALPVDGATMTVDASQASHRRPTQTQSATAGAALPGVETLVFGRGEGRQPAPTYPPHAMRNRQQGTVGVRLTVNAEGRVLDAAVAAKSPWEVLDEAAVQTVRHRWHFPRGRVRVYDVAIRFALAN